LTLLEDGSGFIDLVDKVGGVSKQLFVVNCGFIKDHTSDGRSFMLTESIEDSVVDAVSNKVFSFFGSFEAIKLLGIDLW
jgi:hypothetical protein